MYSLSLNADGRVLSAPGMARGYLRDEKLLVQQHCDDARCEIGGNMQQRMANSIAMMRDAR